jgi:hypothetical protein
MRGIIKYNKVFSLETMSVKLAEMDTKPPAAVVSRLPDMSASRCFAARSINATRCGSKRPCMITACAWALAIAAKAPANSSGPLTSTGSRRRQPEVLHERPAERIRVRVRCQNRDPGKSRNEVAQELQAFASNFRIHCRQASDVSAGISQALHKAGLQRGAGRRHDDRNDSRGTERRSDRRREVGDNDVDAAPD